MSLFTACRDSTIVNVALPSIQRDLHARAPGSRAPHARRGEPLIDLRFFRSAPFSETTLIAVCAFSALGGFLFLNSPYLRDVRGYPALYLLPMAAIVVCAPPSGRILASRGPRPPLAGEQRAYMAGGTRRLG